LFTLLYNIWVRAVAFNAIGQTGRTLIVKCIALGPKGNTIFYSGAGVRIKWKNLRLSAATWVFKGRIIGPVPLSWYGDYSSDHLTENRQFEFSHRQEIFLFSKTFKMRQRPINYTLNVYKDISGRLNRPEHDNKFPLLSSAVVYNRCA
jgi:hypothetical protein